MESQFQSSSEDPQREIFRTADPLELVDQLGPDEAKRVIDEAIDRFLAASRQESWDRRRDRMIRLTRILEQKLDYDIARFCPIETP